MLTIGMNGIVKNYGFKNVLDGVDLEIMEGDRVAIVGRNGGGKTTLLRLITGEELPTSGLVTTRRGASIGYLEQIPRLTEAGETTREMLLRPFAALQEMEGRLRALEREMAGADSEELSRLMQKYAHQQSAYEAADGYAVEERLSRIATGFGLVELLDRPFNVLSGGQKTVVMLAQVMLRQPDILLLDEPTNHLDARTLEWFEATLSKYRGTVVIVSHDRYFLDQVARKTLMIEAGKARLYHGNYSYTLKEQERELMLEFEKYKNQQKQIEQMKAAIRRYRDWGTMAPDNASHMRKAKELERRLEKMEKIDRPKLEKDKIPLDFRGERSSKEVIRLKDFGLSIGGLRLVSGVNQTVLYRQRVCLLGDNGTGKTTLLRALLGELPHEGEATIAPSARMGYIPQEIRFTDGNQSVLEAFREGWPCPEGEARNVLAKYFFVGQHVYKRVSALSGGEKVLLKLAILMRRQINLLILDEPTNHIDIETREMLEDALSSFTGTILFISHDRYFIRKLADRILELSGGRIESFTCDYETYREYKAI